MTWVKFHGELRKGAKRGIPRAVRFIFLELCHEARPGRGVLELPVGMSDLDALQDVLGGDRREVKEALRILTAGAEPMVVIEGDAGARTLTIPSWTTWNAGATESPGASTERSRRHRAAVASSGNGDATAMQRPLHGDATDEQRSGNDRPSGEERREEETRGGPPNPPAGGGASKAPRKRSKPPATENPDVLVAWQAWLDGWRQHVGKGAEPVLDAKRAQLIAASIARHGAEMTTAAGAGVWGHTWNRENGRTDPGLVWRDAEHVERFSRPERPVASRSNGGIPASVPRVQGGFAEFQDFQRMKAERDLEALRPADPPPTQEQLDSW